MTKTLPTVRIQDPHDPDGFIVINESSFDPTVHELLDGEEWPETVEQPEPAPGSRTHRARSKRTAGEEPEADPDALPEDFPARAALERAGITTWSQAHDVEDWGEIRGVGQATEDRIAKALAAHAQAGE